MALALARSLLLPRGTLPLPQRLQLQPCVTLMSLSLGARTMATLSLNNLQLPPGGRKYKKRIGRGIGSGRGKTSGRGHKGQYARSTVRPGFEGGQTPLYKRMPKRGFVNIFRRDLQPVNINKILYFAFTGRINLEEPINVRTLYLAGVVKRIGDGVKLLGQGADELTVPLNVEVTDASASAIEAVERAGGKIRLVYHNRLALRALLHPEKFKLLPRFAKPNNPRLLALYSNPNKRGYLCSEELLAKARTSATEA